MSPERELLKKVGHWYAYDFPEGDIYTTIKAIRELLAKPEREPVAWRGINFTEAEGKWLYRDLDEPFTDHNFKNVGEALYLAPLKREPLSKEAKKDILIDFRASPLCTLFDLLDMVEKHMA